MLFYNLGIRIYYLLIHIAALWSTKAKEWIVGRENISKDLKEYKGYDEKSIWFHCASLGEFEQGRPLIELIKEHHPQTKIVLSFFSPSGYNIQKNYPYADLVTYLPKDYSSDIDHFISSINPMLVVIVKYEYWLNLFKRLDHKGIPRILISARFIKGHYPINLFGRITIPLLRRMKYIFVQDENSAQNLINLDFKNVEFSGDTRVDRVLEIVQQDVELPKVILEFVADKKILVCGSTWYDDEVLLGKFAKELPDDWKMIIAPHEINVSHISKMNSIFPDATFLSQSNFVNENILIVDSIGLLSKLYRLGTLSFVGGAFKTGLHNILEPAAYGLPIIIGPKYSKFNEAVDLVERGGAFSISDITEFKDRFDTLNDSKKYQQANVSILKYMNEQKGSTQKIYSIIKESIFR